MLAVTLSCPQCGAPLPRQALWRTVACTYCGVDVTRSEDLVQASLFHEAYLRARADNTGGDQAIRCLGHTYRRIARLGLGRHAEVLLAERLGPTPERVVIKLAFTGVPAERLQQEYDVMQRLQADSSPGAAYFSQRLPQPIGAGTAQDAFGQSRPALVLRHPTGYWGSLAQVRRNYPAGIDPRHAVWMWRRILEVLGYIHGAGWCHGNLAPEHLLVNPRDHGILIIGWAGAQQPGRAPARDLMQSAWAMRALLAGGDGEPGIASSTPAPLAHLLKTASEDSHWCARTGAQGLDEALKTVARAAFGSPQFVDFQPVPQQ